MFARFWTAKMAHSFDGQRPQKYAGTAATPSEALWLVTSDSAEYVQHDWDRPFHHDPTASLCNGWPSGYVGLDSRCGDCHSRRHGVERTWSKPSGVRRHLLFSARELRPRDLWSIDGLSFHLAVHLERATRDRVGIHWIREICGISLARHHSALTFNGCCDCRRDQYSFALSPHNLYRKDYGDLMGRYSVHNGCGV